MSDSLRMRDLVEQTGTSREAIRYYINEGLLPEPRKTSRNMAWYSHEHVERIRYIKALQEEHFLPLKAIRSVLDGATDMPFTPQQQHQFEVLRARLNAGKPGEKKRDLLELSNELQLTSADTDAVAAMGFADANGMIGADGTDLLQLWSQMRREGLTSERGFGPADMRIVQDAVDLLFGHELKLFTERLGDMNDDEVAHILDRIIPAINRVFSILHERKLRTFLEAIDASGDKQ